MGSLESNRHAGKVRLGARKSFQQALLADFPPDHAEFLWYLPEIAVNVNAQSGYGSVHPQVPKESVPADNHAALQGMFSYPLWTSVGIPIWRRGIAFLQIELSRRTSMNSNMTQGVSRRSFMRILGAASAAATSFPALAAVQQATQAAGARPHAATAWAACSFRPTQSSSARTKTRLAPRSPH